MDVTFKNIFYFLVAKFLGKFIGVFRSFLVAKILQPSDYGIWSGLLLILSYAPIASLGTLESLLKKFPYYMGKGAREEAKTIEDGVFTAILGSALLVFALGPILDYGLGVQSAKGLPALVQIMFGIASLSFVSSYFYHRFAAHQDFKKVSIIDLCRSAITFMAVVCFAWKASLWGAVLGLLTSEVSVLMMSAVLSTRVYRVPAFNFNYRLLAKLVRIGLPITLIWWIFIVQSSIDRLISLFFLGKVATGYYALGVAIASAVSLISQAVGGVIYPKVNEKVGEIKSGKELFGLVVLPARLLSLLLPVILGTLVLLSPTVYLKILPKYGPGLVAGQILTLGVFFIGLIKIGANFLIATDGHHKLIVFLILGVIVNIAGNIILVKLGLDIAGIALSTSLSGAVVASLVWKSVFQNIGFTEHPTREVFKLYLPYFTLVALLALSCLLRPGIFRETSMQSLLNVFVFCAAFGGIIRILPPCNVWAREGMAFVRVKVQA